MNRFEDGDVVTPELLKEKGIIKKQLNGVKVLGNGELEKKITVILIFCLPAAPSSFSSEKYGTISICSNCVRIVAVIYGMTLGILAFVMFTLVYLLIIVGVIWIQEAERRIPVQYSNRTASSPNHKRNAVPPVKTSALFIIASDPWLFKKAYEDLDV